MIRAIVAGTILGIGTALWGGAVLGAVALATAPEAPYQSPAYCTLAAC